MKKFFYILFSALMAVVACQKQQVEPLCSMEETGHGTYIFTIKALDAGIEPEVKSDYDAAGHFSWSAGDAISVLFHKGTENKFFTLTTATAGKSVTFSGEITSGYEIGASDGNASDKKIWALFPASANHTYAEGSNPNFYVQPEVDFTAPGAHYSANIPMYSLVATETGGLSFANLACAYKFIVEDIDSSIDNVRFEVSNQTTYGLSGSWPIDDSKFINYNYAAPGTEKSCLSYTSNVTDKKAVFYVSCRYWGTFQPLVNIYNADNNNLLKTVKATTAKTPTDKTSVQPITISAPGTGTAPFVPAVVIDGLFTDWDGVTEYDGTRNGGGANSRINHWRATSDAQNVYFYAELVTSKIKHSSYFYVGFDTAEGGSSHGGLNDLEQYAVIYPCVSGSDPITYIQGADPRSTVNGSTDGNLTVWSVNGDGVTYIEMCIPRSKVSLSSAGTIKVALAFDYYDTISQTLVLE